MIDHTLIKIARFGKIVNKQGEFPLRLYADYDSALSDLVEFFILFDDGRVRFSKVELREAGESKLFAKIDDNSTFDEVEDAELVWLAIDEEAYYESTKSPSDTAGMTVYMNEQVVGVVDHSFHNNFYQTLVILKDSSEDSFMIPDVDEYVIEKDFEQKIIKVRNIEELMDL